MAEAKQTTAATIKETLISITIAFTMAFVFRGFVIEGFQIPTGSMAPTLLGKHVKAVNPESGSMWTVGPRDYRIPHERIDPAPVQGQTTPIRLNDPVTGADIEYVGGVPLHSGDRLFVLKYLWGLYEPKRWDVVVFKAPHASRENYIKRLLGMPGEQMVLVDGDVFARPEATYANDSGIAAWGDDDWRIQRKPERAQRAMWRTVFDGSLTPPNPSQRFVSPWTRTSGSWSGLADSREYAHEGASTGELTWNSAVRPIDDYTSYNQYGKGGQSWDRARVDHASIFPVSDVAVAAGVEPGDGFETFEVVLKTRDATMTASIDAAGVAKLEGRHDRGDWSVEAQTDGLTLAVGRATRVEFWHVDQALYLYVDGELVLGGADEASYELSPSARVLGATGRSLSDVLSRNPGLDLSPLADSSMYRRPELSLKVQGAVTLHDVKVDRDVYYQVAPKATYGGHPEFFPTIDGDHYFFAGDNSPSSLDGRLWGNTDPWIIDSIEDGDATPLVHRDLVIGRAFVVYFPSPLKDGPVPMFDFGRMRWVW